MRIYSKPETKLIQNETLMAEKCNEQFIWTSAAGVQPNGYANVCYHYQFEEYGTICISKYKGKVIDIPNDPKITFVNRTKVGNYQENGKWYSTDLNGGWDDFEGTNGTCHYLGYIYYNGTLIDESNINNLPWN